MKTIFDILRWVYLSELSKVSGGGVDLGYCGSSWGAIDEYARLGTLIDAGFYNQFGVLFDRYSNGEPHADALFLGGLLKGLSAARFTPFYDVCPLSDLVLLGDDSRGIFDEAMAQIFEEGYFKQDIHEFFSRAIILDRLPKFKCEPIKKQLVQRNGNPAWFIKAPVVIHGKEFEVEEFSVKSKGNRPAKGSYQKHEWLPSPASIIASRLEYALFYSVMGYLEAELAEFNPNRAFEPLVRDNRAIEFSYAFDAPLVPYH